MELLFPVTAASCGETRNCRLSQTPESWDNERIWMEKKEMPSRADAIDVLYRENASLGNLFHLWYESTEKK